MPTGQGFGNIEPDSSRTFRKNNSWGRTRTPKNILSNLQRAGVDAGTIHGVVHADGDALTLPTDLPSLSTDGYLTENQRYLHVSVKCHDPDVDDPLTLGTDESSNGTATLQVWIYSHALDRWSELQVHTGNGQWQPVAIAQTASGTDTYYIFDIAGADKVYLRQYNQNHNGTLQCYVACSTF